MENFATKIYDSINILEFGNKTASKIHDVITSELYKFVDNIANLKIRIFGKNGFLHFEIITETDNYMKEYKDKENYLDAVSDIEKNNHRIISNAFDNAIHLLINE